MDTHKTNFNETASFQKERRHFLKRSALAVSALGLAPYVFTSQTPLKAQGPNDRLRVGCVGVGNMGRGDASEFSWLADVVALCDVDKEYGIAETLKNNRIGKIVNGKKQGEPDTYQDYRRILDRKDIDIVSIATVDHWHTKIAIEAMQSGKHVFCQKPLTLTIEEGQLIRNACKKYPDLKFQVGSQQRSQKKQFATACLMVRKGMLGKIRRMTVDIGGGQAGGPFPKQAPPESLDWNFWLGQCPQVEYIPQRCHRTFRYWVEYSAGTLTDWGAHHIDFCTWALDEEAQGRGPIRIDPLRSKMPIEFKDGYPVPDDYYSTCSRFRISCQYASGVEVLICNQTPDGNGILIEGENGKIHVNRERIKGKPIEDKLHESLTEEDFVQLNHDKRYENHKQNFIRCIREGGVPASEPSSHISAMDTCHLAAIAARVGRAITWNPEKLEIVDDELAASFIAREQRKGFEIPKV